MKYALIKISTNEIEQEVRDNYFGSTTPPNISQKDLKWLPIEITNPAVTEHTTQIKEGPVTTVEADKVTKVWTVRPLTEQELDDAKELQIPPSDSITFKTMLDVENRTLALESKPAVTASEYRETLKAML